MVPPIFPLPQRKSETGNLLSSFLGQAEAAPPAGRGMVIDPALSFTRISRAVRLTIALEARMRRQIEAGVFGAANDDRRGDSGFLRPIDYAAIKRRMHPLIHGETDYEIRRAMDETIENASNDPDEAERLKTEMKELLEDEEEVFVDRYNWPTGEVIALICQDLGIEPDWDRWKTRPWARKEAEQNWPGSPYAVDPLPPHQHYRSGTEKYRKARGLAPLDGAAAVLRDARGPP